MLKIRYSAMRRVLLGLVALAVFAASADAAAATLRWKFKPGETLRYAMEQRTVTTLKVFEDNALVPNVRIRAGRYLN